MTIVIEVERSEACSQSTGHPVERVEVPFDTTDGPWTQITHDSIRTQDGAALVTYDDGWWWWNGLPFSDVIVEARP